MGEISKAVGQWIVSNVGWTAVIVLFILSGIFKIAKVEIDPAGAVIRWLGKKFTADVIKDVADLKKENQKKFEEVKTDRAAKIEELKNDYVSKISELRADLDSFETKTNSSIAEMKDGTVANCELLKKRLDAVEKSNDLQTVRQIKEHVFNFANSCISKRKHTRQDFDNIIKENAEYESLVKKHNLTNEVYDEDYKYILKVYDKCKEENSFLKGED